MVGDVGAFQRQGVLKWTPIEAVILVNKGRQQKYSVSSCAAFSPWEKCPRCMTTCVNTSILAHVQISSTDLKGKYGGMLPRVQDGKLFHRNNKLNTVEGAGRQHQRRFKLAPRAEVSLATGLEVINDLGLDTLTFLAVTVLVVPAFKAIKASPILGFFVSGVVLNQLGLIRNIVDVKALSELGILFLLFEMGLELSLARLRALAKFAFGMGLAQVLFSTLAFTAFELPPNGAIGTKVLEFLFHSRPDLVNIRTIDEAVVIGAALSMSSSAFVLQVSVVMM